MRFEQTRLRGAALPPDIARQHRSGIQLLATRKGRATMKEQYNYTINLDMKFGFLGACRVNAPG